MVFRDSFHLCIIFTLVLVLHLCRMSTSVYTEYLLLHTVNMPHHVVSMVRMVIKDAFVNICCLHMLSERS